MLYLDTEFTSFNGRLLSMGICSSEHSEEFYEVLELPRNQYVHPWIVENVYPFLMKDPVNNWDFSNKLKAYLLKHQKEEIIADWPEDIGHLLSCMCEEGGYSWRIELSFKLIQSGKLTPVIPHNALSDARALRDWHQQQLKQS